MPRRRKPARGVPAPAPRGAPESHLAFREYWQLRMESATTRLRAARRVIEHNPTRGGLAENVLRELVREFLPHRWGIGSGFLMLPGDRVSRQMDLLVYDLLSSTALYRDADLVVLSPEMTRATVEVKSNPNGRDFADALASIESVKALSPATFGAIFSYDSFGPDALEEYLRAYVGRTRRAGLDRQLLPDRLYFFQRQVVVVRGETGDAHTYRAHRVADPVIRHLLQDVLSTLEVVNFRAYAEAAVHAEVLFSV